MAVDTWFVSAPGEREAGILPSAATVELPMHSDASADEIEFVRGCFKRCFGQIWGESDARVSVVTDVEIRKRDDAEKEYGP